MRLKSALESPLEFHCGKKIALLYVKVSTFMNCLLRIRVQMGIAKLKEDFGFADLTVSKAFMKVKTISSEMFISSFQFKT